MMDNEKKREKIFSALLKNSSRLKFLKVIRRNKRP